MLKYYIFFLIIGFILCIILNLTGNYFNISASYYILSSISQGLAALLALVFTASLIILQVFKRFSAWKLALSPENVYVVLIFCIGIILPLIILRMRITPFLVNLSISITVICVLTLLPFIMNIGKIMSSSIILSELEECIIDAVNKKARGRVASFVVDFRDIWISKIDKKDYASIEEIWNIWKNINTRIRSLHDYRIELDVILEVCKKLTTTRTKEVERFDDYAYRLYNTFRVRYNYSPPVPTQLCDNYIERSRKLLKLAIQKNYKKLSQLIVATLALLVWEKWFRAGPVDNRDAMVIAQIKLLLEINKKYVRSTLEDSQIISLMGDSGREVQQQVLNWVKRIEEDK